VARKLTTENWQGVHPNLRTVEEPDWDEVEAAVRALDQRVHTQVAVGRDDWSSILVGGGSGRYNVAITTADDVYLTLTDPSRGDGTERLVAGGQVGDYPERTVVGLGAALCATRTFFESGAADSGLTWVEE
jgi:hypothetical protein